MPKSRNIMKDLEENRRKLTQNQKEIMGYGPVMSSIIDPKLKQINYDNVSINNVRTTSATLFNIKGKDSESGQYLSDLLYAKMQSLGSKDEAEYDQVMQSIRYKIREYSTLVRELPEISNVLNLLADDTVHPNASGTSGIKIEFKNNRDTEGETYSDLIRYFRPLEDVSNTMAAKRLYSYDIDVEAKARIKSTCIYGATIVCTIPYSSIVNDLLYKKEQNAKMGESMNLATSFVSNKEFYFDDFQKDVIDRMDSAYESRMAEYDNVEKDSKTNQFLRNIAGQESKNIHIMNHTFYSRKDLDYVSMMLSNQANELKENNNHYKGSTSDGDITSLLGISEDANQVRNELREELEVIKDKKKLKFNIDKIRGCTNDILDLNKVFPLFIKDELMGCILLDTEQEEIRSKVGSSLQLLMSNQQGSVADVDDVDYKTRLKNMIIQDMGDILEANLDKKLLRNNPQLIEEIDFLLDSASIQDLAETKIRFIPAEYLTIYRVGAGWSSNGGGESNNMGTSMLEESKPYIHALIQLNKTGLINETMLNKARYLFKIKNSNDASGWAQMVDSARMFRNIMPQLNQVGDPAVANNSLRNYHTILVPQLPGGDDMFSIEKLDTEYNPQDPEMIARIRNAATQPFGYPADILDPSQNVDFAKKIANINMSTLIKILGIQRAFTLPLTEECTRRIRYLTGNHNLEAIVTFDPPNDIAAQINNEMISVVESIQGVYEKLVDEDPEVADERKDLLKFAINSNLIKEVLGMEYYEKMKKEIIVKGVPNDETLED